MLLDLIKERRSIRIFDGKKIEKDKIGKILEAGIWAPTGCNNQEIKFLTIGDEVTLNETLKFKSFFRGVSHFILVFCDMSIPMSKKLYKRNSSAEAMSDLDSGLAIQNMVLQAKDLGVDSCIVNLSEKHYKKEKNLSFLQKISKELKKKLNMHESNPNSFEYFLRNYLKVPKHFKIKAGVVLGYGKNFPDLARSRHGKNLIARCDVKDYLVTDKYAE